MLNTDICKVWFEAFSEVADVVNEMYVSAHNEYVNAAYTHDHPDELPFLACYDSDVAPFKERANALKYCLQLVNNPDRIMGQIAKMHKNE